MTAGDGAAKTTDTETTDNCRYCWMCRHVCPVGHVTHRETLTPHAWAMTIASVRRGTLQWTDESADVLYQCADCGLCRTFCVTDQPLPDAIVAARAEAAAAGVAPKAAYAIRDQLERWGNPYAALAGSRAPRDAPEAPAATRVALFVGDAGAHLGAGSVNAALALLAAAGVSATPIGAGRSTGVLASALGFPATASTLGRAVLEDVERARCEELLVLSPGDRFAFERVYGDRLQLEWPGDVTVREVTTVLAEALERGSLALRRRSDPPAYAYHDPCHAPRIGRTGLEPRVLLRAALGETAERKLFWREGRAHPCGAIGGLEFTFPDIASRLADARLADAAGAHVSWLITEDPACLHQLRSRPPAGVEVVGLYELLAAQIQS